jgi:hypothetical protein
MSDRDFERLAERLNEDTRLADQLYEPLPTDFGKEPIVRALTPRRCSPKGGIYGLFDRETDRIMYGGRTRNFAIREHQWSRDPILGEFRFKPLFGTDYYAEQRGLEQAVYWQNRPPFNLINPVGPINLNRVNYISSATIYLRNLNR